MKLSASIVGVLCSTVPCSAIVMQREPQRGSLSSGFAKTAVSTTALLELEHQLDKMAVGTVDPTGDLLGEVGNLIRETMMPGIVSSHNSTQQQLNGFAAAFGACPDPITGDVSEGLDEYKFTTPQCQDGIKGENWCSEWCNTEGKWGCGVAKNTEKDHECDCTGCNGCKPPQATSEFIQLTLIRRRRRRDRRRRSTPTTTTTTLDPVASQFAQVAACRVREGAAAAALAACQSALLTVETTKNSSCHALRDLQTTPVPATLCAPTDPYDQWLISTNTQVGNMKKHLGELKDGCGNATQLLNDKVAECGAAKIARDGNKTSCDELQTAAEAAICVVTQPDSEKCTAYDTCYNNAVSAYTDENATIVEMHLNWTVQWRTLKRMECLLDIMSKGGTNDDIDACKDKLWDTTWLDLDYPAIPPKKECSAAAKRPAPCEQSFLTQHYGANPENAPAAACVPCATAETTTAPPIPPTVWSTTNSDSPWTTNEAAKSPWGGSGGGAFNDFYATTKYGDLAKVCVRHGSMIDAIRVMYWEIRPPGYTKALGMMALDWHGGSGGSEWCLTLQDGEKITSLTIRSGGSVDGLEIQTSTGRAAILGGQGGSPHKLEYTGKHLVSIFGASGGSLDSLGAVFSE